MNNINEKLAKLAAKEASNWIADAEYRQANRDWLRKSGAIAVQILGALKAQALSQKELADRLGITPQQISKIVKGHENLTLETICKLETALGIQLINVPTSDDSRPLKKKNPAA